MLGNRRRITRRGFGATLVGAATWLGAPFVRAQQARPITFLLDVTPYGKHSLFYPAIEKGYFKDAGLDVRFESAKGSADNVVKIASGVAQFGFADTPASALARAVGAKTKQVLMVHYKAMNAVVSLSSNPVRTPQDMVGKSFGATAGDAPRVALPALAQINGFDATKVELVTIEESTKPALLLSKRTTGILGLAAYTPVYANVVGITGDKVVEMLFSDFGLDIYSNGVVVSDALLAKDPELVRSFNEALVRSMKFACENRDEAVETFMKFNPTFSPKTARGQLDVAIDHLLVEEVKEHGIGPMSAKKMEFTLDIVRKFYGLKGPVETEEVFSNDFVKPGTVPT
jgi:NitT/TauT family transport system substrate-binding protein